MSYFDERITGTYQAQPEHYTLPLRFQMLTPDGWEWRTAALPLLEPTDDNGIAIHTANLDGELNYYYDAKSKTPEKPLQWSVKRIAPEQVKGSNKYMFPPTKRMKVGTFPFVPVPLHLKFKQRTPIENLVITEGFLKAFVGAMHGIDIVGLGSITHYRDSEKKGIIHNDIRRLITELKPKYITLLYDADCLKISASDLEAHTELSERPKGFLNSALMQRDLLLDFGAQIIFAHLVTPEKGIDDLIVGRPDERAAILADIAAPVGTGNYFHKINITERPQRLRQHFNLDRLENFYEAHKELIGEKEFVYDHTHWKYNSTDSKIEMITPANAKDYMLVGNDFYELVKVPDKYRNLEEVIHRRNSGIIKMLHGEKFMKHIKPYKAFCNVPDHSSYQQVIHSCYNLYHEFQHKPEPGNCPTTLKFLEHIFGEQLQLGIDYVQLLVQQPVLPRNTFLPILCLVGKDQGTGKSTFAKWLKEMFGKNMAIVGNAELNSDFNHSFASKLIICCEESFIEKRLVIEKIKSLATADKVMMNAKNRDVEEISFFGKFILISNHEENFIWADNQDTRYWIRKITPPPAGTSNVNLLNELVDEVPQFLHYLANRQMSVPQPESRFWFTRDSLRTAALQKLVEGSRRTIYKDIKETVKELLYENNVLELNISITELLKRVNDNSRYKHSKAEVKQCVEQDFLQRFELKHAEIFVTDDLGEKKREKTTGRFATFTAAAMMDEEEFTRFNASFETAAAPQQLAMTMDEKKDEDLPF